MGGLNRRTLLSSLAIAAAAPLQVLAEDQPPAKMFW